MRRKVGLPLDVGRNNFRRHGAVEDVYQALAGEDRSKDRLVGLTVACSEQGEFGLDALLLEKVVDLDGGEGPLQTLAVEFGLFDLGDGLVALDGETRTAEVAATAAAGDHVGHAGTLVGEGLGVNGGAEELLAELDHLEQTDAHDGGFGVVPPAQTVDPTGGEGDDVLEGPGQRDAGDIAGHADVEVGTVEDGLPELVVDGRETLGHGLQLGLGDLAGGVLVLEGRTLSGGQAVLGGRIVGDGGLGPLLARHLVGDVGTGQGTAVDAELVPDPLREQVGTLLVDVDTLDARDGAGIGGDLALDGLAGADDELVRQVEDQDGAVLDGVDQIRVGHEVGGQLDAGQVLDVLMLGVDNLGQVLGALAIVDLFLEHPHLDRGLEQRGVAGGIFSHDLSNGTSPVLCRHELACARIPDGEKTRERETYQLPDPTTVILCLRSYWWTVDMVVME